MKPFIARTADGTYGVVIGVNVLKQINRFCTAAGEYETGGIITGRYSSDLSNALVSEATAPPPDSEKGRAVFVRGVYGLARLLRKRWAAKRRTYYLGEWHFHPTTVIEPSQVDYDQMFRIAGAKEYSCNEPLLLLVGQRACETTGRPIVVYVFPSGKSPIEVTLNGQQ